MLTKSSNSRLGVMCKKNVMNEGLIFTTTISIVTSVIGGLIVYYYLIYRDNKIKKQIEELEYEEVFLDKISRGNTKLIRSTFMVILFSISAIAVSVSVVFLAHALNLSEPLKGYAFSLGSWILLIVVGTCFFQLKSIMSLSDIKKAKENLESKKKKLERKIKNS